MNNRYDKTVINELSSRIKKAWVFCAVGFCLLIVAFVLTGLFIGDQTLVLFKILLSVLSAVLVCFLIYEIIFKIVLNKEKIKHINRVLNGKKEKLSGEVVFVSDYTTLKKNVKGFVVEIKNEERSLRVLYECEESETLPFNLNDSLTFKVSDNFVLEVEQNEKVSL